MTTADGARGRALIALIPAHDEEAGIGDAIDGLRRQSLVPRRIVVVADNCSDATAQIAAERGAEVFTTVGNRDKKAGALNQALAWLLPQADGEALILIQDADAVLNPQFVRSAADALDGDTGVGAVGGIFHGLPGGGLIGLLQRMEYQRYATEIARRHYEAVVLTGTGTLFRAGVLREVCEARRAGRLSGGDSYYSLASLTEDDEMTKAVKTLGYRTVSPPGCVLVTEVMARPGALFHQRLRWQRGALENLHAYGWTPVTAWYFRQQLALSFTTFAMASYLLYVPLHLAVWGWHGFAPFWATLTGIFVIERTLTVRPLGRRAVFLAALLFPELCYDVFLHAVHVRSMWDLLRRRPEDWQPT